MLRHLTAEQGAALPDYATLENKLVDNDILTVSNVYSRYLCETCAHSALHSLVHS